MYDIPEETKEQKYYAKMPYRLNEEEKAKFDEGFQTKLKKQK